MLGAVVGGIASALAGGAASKLFGGKPAAQAATEFHLPFVQVSIQMT